MKIIILVLFLLKLLVANQVIHFAPLPMRKSEKLMKQYIPAIKYLEDTTKLKYNIEYVADYDLLLQKLKKNEIDLAFLGPLPYVKLTKNSKNFEPIVRFLNSNGEDRYTCSLFTLNDSNINLKDIKNKEIALTQKYSTCGYLAVEKILNKNSLSIKMNDFFYSNSHSNVVLDLVLGKADVGGAKTSIAKEYSHLGLKFLATSEKFPGFLLVGNRTTLSKEDMQKIKEAFLKLKPLQSSDDFNITKKWGKNLKYGSVVAQDEDYDIIRDILKQIEIPKQ